MLYNLCHNAVKFAAEQGKFRISITRITDTKLRVSVFDQGQTITEDDAKLIFDRFYKGKNASEGSIGIGLALAKAIVEANHGKIGVESSKNGTEFEIRYFK